MVKAPSTLGTFPRSFRWGPRPSVGSGEPRAAGTGLGRRDRTRRRAVDHRLDSTICETYGLAKEGARHHSYTSQRGYHPLLARARTLGPAPATC